MYKFTDTWSSVLALDRKGTELSAKLLTANPIGSFVGVLQEKQDPH